MERGKMKIFHFLSILLISSLVTFEIAFAHQVNSNLNNDSDIILTLSNDAWFGSSHGPWQHLQIAQMRALEFAKPVVRVTNNGVTAVISAEGNVEQLLPQFEAAVLSHELRVYQSQTFYQQFGNFPAWVMAILVSLLSLVLTWRPLTFPWTRQS